MTGIYGHDLAAPNQVSIDVGVAKDCQMKCLSHPAHRAAAHKGARDNPMNHPWLRLSISSAHFNPLG